MVEWIGTIAQFLPVLLILWVANLAQKRRSAGEPYRQFAHTAYALVALIHLPLLLAGLTVLLRQEELPLEGTDLVKSWAWLGWGMVVPTGLGLLMLLRAVRAKAGNVLKIDPDNPLHAVSLSMSLWVPLLLAATLGIGLDTLAMQLEMQNDLTEQPPVSVGLLWLQTALFVLIALIGTGWLTRRSWSATLARLRIVRPSPRDAAIGIGWALGMVPAVMLLEAAAQTLGVGIDADVDALTEQLIGPLIESPWGIVSIGLAAGIGEEALFRGALLPRFGRVYTALLFALLHSNYGITLSTVVVFLLGLMLGWLATRYNTTTAMIAHAVYNSTLALLAVTAVQVLNQQ